MNVNEILPLIPDDYYDPSEIVLIGSHMEPSPKGEVPNESSDPKDHAKYLESLCTGEMRVRSDLAHSLNLIAVPKMHPNDEGKQVWQVPTIALIYAYGYEGHTYRLTKPRIMIVSGAGKPYEAAATEGPSPSLTGKLYMWRMSKHHQTISIEVESGELEKLVLEANQPGNRAVNSYAAHMQMSHRGGKLS